MLTTANAIQATALTEVKGETSIFIQCSPQQAYDYLLDFTKHPEWVLNISKVTKETAGPISVGTKFKTSEMAPPVPLLKRMQSMLYFMQGMFSGANSYSNAEITALEAGRRIAWTGRVRKGASDFNVAHWEVILEAQNGGTLLTQRFNYVPQTEASRKMVGALGGPEGIAAACGRSLAKLKSILEQ
jgi:hypothetical protein